MDSIEDLLEIRIFRVAHIAATVRREKDLGQIDFENRRATYYMENIDPSQLSETALRAIVAVKTGAFAEECKVELAKRERAKAVNEAPPEPLEQRTVENNIDQVAANDLNDVINRIRRNPKQGGPVS